MSEYIAPYILRKEYECPCCHRIPYILEKHGIVTPYNLLFESFELIRNKWGKPIRISSGYRCPKFNRAIGGAELSVHLFGLALDLDLDNVQEVRQLDQLIERWTPQLRRGTYEETGTFIHIDVAYFIYPIVLEEWHEGARWTDY